MFKNPLSFKGRIRRKEYGVSFLIYLVATGIMNVAFVDEAMTDTQALIILGVLLPMFFVLFAQGAKRSHDLGNSGWFILIPFYMLWLLFADGVPGPNKYGDNPKGIGNDPLFTFERNDQSQF